METAKYMPDFLLESVFNTLITLTNQNFLKWKLHSNIDDTQKYTKYVTVDSRIELFNCLYDHCASISELTLNYYNKNLIIEESYTLKNITYPIGSDNYTSNNYDRWYYRLTTAINDNILRNRSDEYKLIDYLATITNQKESL